MDDLFLNELNQKFQEAYRQKTLLVCLYRQEQDIHRLTGHPEFSAGFPASCDLTSLTRRLLVQGKRPNLWFTFNHEAGLEQLFHRLDFHFHWLTRHREHLQPVVWLHESAFMVLNAMLDERTKKKIRILHLTGGVSDHADRLMVPVVNDLHSWEKSKKCWGPALLEMNRHLLGQDLPLMERLYHSQHQVRLLQNHPVAERVNAQWDLVQVYGSFVAQGHTRFLMDLVEHIDGLSALNIFALPTPEALEMVQEAVKMHVKLIEAGHSKSPPHTWNQVLGWLVRVMGRATPDQVTVAGKTILEQAVQGTSQPWNTPNPNFQVTQLRSLVHLYRMVVSGLSEVDVLHQGNLLMGRLEAAPSGLWSLMLQCRTVQVQRLMELNSIHQQEAAAGLLRWIRTHGLQHEFLRMLPREPAGDGFSWPGDHIVLLELISEVIEKIQATPKTPDHTDWTVLAELYHQRSWVQQHAHFREQDLRSALELYQKAMHQSLPEGSRVLDARGCPMHLCLPMARVLRDLHEWEEALQWITEGIWRSRLQTAEPPLRGAFTTQVHLEEELIEHLAERVRILEGWMAGQPDRAGNLIQLLLESQQALACWKPSSGTSQRLPSLL